MDSLEHARSFAERIERTQSPQTQYGMLLTEAHNWGILEGPNAPVIQFLRGKIERLYKELYGQS